MSKGLIQFYSACAKNIRANGRRIKPGKREYWLFPHAESLVRGGTKLVGLESLSLAVLSQTSAQISRVEKILDTAEKIAKEMSR